MLITEELRLELESYRPKMAELYEVLDVENCRKKIAELQAAAAEPDFWNDTEHSQKILREMKKHETQVKRYEKLNAQLEDALTLIELADDEEDESLVPDIKREAEEFKRELDEVTLSTLLTGEYDGCNAILSFHAGAGGTEAQDWAQMLFRMYNRWGERHGYQVRTLDYLDGGEAGIKSAAILIEGENAYGYLKSEAGIHRLVRISPFDASGSRHTSFAAVDVMPEIDESADVEIRAEDLKTDTYRASGAGGQHINKTDSAVRITHLPTGIVVSCQTQRSQHQNRDYAMKMLKAKLIEIKEREHLEKIEDIKGVQKEIAWGAQIRSYVFMPYTLAKDHRTGFESGNIHAVMDGEIDGFINAYLKAASLGTLNA